MTLSLIVVEGKNVSAEALRSVSLANAKQLVVGDAYGFGVVLHVAAESVADLGTALARISEVPNVSGVTTVALRNPQ